MKKLFGSLFCLAFLCWSFPVFAVPALQLDIGGGYYNTNSDPRYNDETIVSAGDVFTLYALLDVPKNEKGTLLTDTYHISMAVFPHISLTSPAPDFGSFMFDGTEIKATGDMSYGTPDIAPHGVFDTYFAIYDFEFNQSNQVGSYNTQEHPGQFDNYYPGTGLYFAAFDVDTTKLSDDVSIHFDLFSDNKFAPFSHDADAQSDPPSPPVPEPASMLLLGLGLLGIAGLGKKMRG